MAADMKRYIISFHATLQGHQAVLSSLKNMEGQVKGVTTATTTGAKATETYSQSMARLGKRALMVIPIWLLLRTVFMGVLRTFGDMVRANLDLEEGLARIRTVMHGTAASIDTEMIAVRRQILDMSVKSRMSIKELSEAFYFLKTANLDATEAMAAFEPTVHAAVGTMNSAKDTARAVAGMYNTMGEYLGENLTVHEKFRKIADVLSYTYATQDVQLSELVQSYTQLAPYVTGLSDNFTEVITLLGFLNTRLLRAGRTGRLTGRAVLQLTKNAKQLAAIFGITFDPDQPINLLRTIEQIRDSMGKTGQMTARQGQAIQRVFATRGGVAVRLLIEHFDDLRETIGLAEENVDGFAEKMNEIRMGTTAAQMERMRNILATLMNDFARGYLRATDLSDALRVIGDTLESLRTPFMRTGQLLGWIARMVGDSIEAIQRFNRIGTIPTEVRKIGLRRPEVVEDYLKMFGKPTAKEAFAGYDFTSWREYLAEQEELTKTAEKEEKVREKIRKTEEEVTKFRTNTLKEEEAGLKHQVKLLKIVGANTLDIAKYRLEALENVRDLMTQEDYELELMERQNDVLEEQQKYRKNIVEVLEEAEIAMLKNMGATELQLLNIREKHLEAQRALIGETQYLLKLGQLRTQQAIALQAEKRKELEQATNLYVMYEKADMMERGRIRRLIELMALTPEELAGRFRKDMYDQKVILEYWNNFSEQAQFAMGEAIRQMRALPMLDIPSPEMPAVAKKLLPHGEISEYWQLWIGQGKDAANIVATEFTKTLKKIPFGGILEGRMELPAPEIKPTFGDININLPEDTLERMSELTGEKLTEKLKTDESLQRFLAQALRPYI